MTAIVTGRLGRDIDVLFTEPALNIEKLVGSVVHGELEGE